MPGFISQPTFNSSVHAKRIEAFSQVGWAAAPSIFKPHMPDRNAVSSNVMSHQVVICHSREGGNPVKQSSSDYFSWHQHLHSFHAELVEAFSQVGWAAAPSVRGLKMLGVAVQPTKQFTQYR
jgi:hypothetical protein